MFALTMNVFHNTVQYTVYILPLYLFVYLLDLETLKWILLT